MINTANGLCFIGCIASLVRMLCVCLCVQWSYYISWWAHLPPYVHRGFHQCAFLHVCVCVWACMCAYVSMFCENNSWQWVSEMWWPSTGSLEFCQCGGLALIIKNTFTERISAMSVVGCTLQGHIQDNHTEKKVWKHCTEKKSQRYPLCDTERSLHGMAVKHPQKPNKQTKKNNYRVFFFHSYLANWIIQLLLFYLCNWFKVFILFFSTKHMIIFGSGQ